PVVLHPRTHTTSQARIGLQHCLSQVGIFTVVKHKSARHADCHKKHCNVGCLSRRVHLRTAQSQDIAPSLTFGKVPSCSYRVSRLSRSDAGLSFAIKMI